MLENGCALGINNDAPWLNPTIVSLVGQRYRLDITESGRSVCAPDLRRGGTFFRTAGAARDQAHLGTDQGNLPLDAPGRMRTRNYCGLLVRCKLISILLAVETNRWPDYGKILARVIA